MKTFKLTLLAITTALFLQGCGDDNDGPSTSQSDQSDTPQLDQPDTPQPDQPDTPQPDQPDTPQPDQPNINTEIIGTWSSDDSSSELSAIVFMDDKTYVQVQVDNSQSTSEPKNGMEWGSYSINDNTGKLAATPIFDKNGSSGLSDSVNRYAKVSNGKLVLEVDEDNNGVIDNDEIYYFSKTEPEGILGSWSFDDADDKELVGLAFFENGTYIQVQVDETGSVNNSENGMEWGYYTVDPTTGRLATSIIYDNNDGVGLSEPRTRYARVTGNTALTLEIDDNQDGTIGNKELFNFSRPS